MLLIGLSLMLPLFPVAGMTDVTLAGCAGWRRYLDVAHHLFLPALTLASIFLAALQSPLPRKHARGAWCGLYPHGAGEGTFGADTVYRHALKIPGPGGHACRPAVLGRRFGRGSGRNRVQLAGSRHVALQSILARDTPTILGILFSRRLS